MSFKADLLKIQFLSTLSLPCDVFVPASAENMSLLTWLTGQKTCSAVKCENNIINEREGSIKAAEKDLGTTVVTSIEIQLVQLLSIVYVHW